jgi:hypothetical protein
MEPIFGNYYENIFPFITPSVYPVSKNIRSYTDKKEKKNSSYSILGNSDGIRCKVIYEEGLPMRKCAYI